MSKVRIFERYAGIFALCAQANCSENSAITISAGATEGHLSLRDVCDYVHGIREVHEYPDYYKADPVVARHCRTGSFTPRPSLFENGGFKDPQQIVEENIVTAVLSIKKFSPPKVSKNK